MKDLNVPIWHKAALTIDEAAAYSNIGRNQLRWMISAPECPFVLTIGKKKLIKRELFDEFIRDALTISKC